MHFLLSLATPDWTTTRIRRQHWGEGAKVKPRLETSDILCFARYSPIESQSGKSYLDTDIIYQVQQQQRARMNSKKRKHKMREKQDKALWFDQKRRIYTAIMLELARSFSLTSSSSIESEKECEEYEDGSGTGGNTFERI